MELNEREKEIQKVCNSVLNLSIMSTGDSGTGGCCPFCLESCRWDAGSVRDIKHQQDCVVLIAKDLTVGFIKINYD